MRLFGRVSALGFFEPLLEICKPLFKIFFAHASTSIFDAGLSGVKTLNLHVSRKTIPSCLSSQDFIAADMKYL